MLKKKLLTRSIWRFLELHAIEAAVHIEVENETSKDLVTDTVQ